MDSNKKKIHLSVYSLEQGELPKMPYLKLSMTVKGIQYSCHCTHFPILDHSLWSHHHYYSCSRQRKSMTYLNRCSSIEVNCNNIDYTIFTEYFVNHPHRGSQPVIWIARTAIYIYELCKRIPSECQSLCITDLPGFLSALFSFFLFIQLRQNGCHNLCLQSVCDRLKFEKPFKIQGREGECLCI